MKVHVHNDLACFMMVACSKVQPCMLEKDIHIHRVAGWLGSCQQNHPAQLCEEDWQRPPPQSTAS